MAIFEVLLGSVNMTGMGPIASVRRRLRHVRSTSNNCRDDAVPRTAERCQQQSFGRVTRSPVGAGEQRWMNVQSERLCRRQIDNEIKFGRLLDRNFCRLSAPQDFVDVVAGASV